MNILRQPTSIALSRSPYVYQVGLPAGTYTQVKFICRVYIWSGDSNTRPTPVNYTFTKYANENEEAIFDISSVVHDELKHYSYNSMTLGANNGMGQAVWVQCSFSFTSAETVSNLVDTFIVSATAGYYDYPNGINQAFTPYATIQTYNRRVTKEQRLFVPVYLFNGANSVTIRDDNGNAHTISLVAVDRDVADNFIQYIDVSPDRLAAYSITPTDTIQVSIYTGATPLEIWNFNYVCEPKYTPVPVVYLNKHGVWDVFTFFKKSSTAKEMTNKTYSNNFIWPYDPTPSGSFYDAAQGQERAYNTNLIDTVTLNTDYLNEDENEQIFDLLVSERIFIQEGSYDVGVLISSKQMDYKTDLNDKLVQYTMTFKRAYSNINTSAV